MSIIMCIVYGLLSGIAEFLPISSRAHQSLLLFLSGKPSRDPLQDLLVHIAVLLALLFFGRTTLVKFRAEKARRNRRQGRLHQQKIFYDSRLIRTAAVPLIIGSLAYTATAKVGGNLPIIAVFLVLNAVILFVTEHIRHGNKDASVMSGLDGIVMGICGAFSSFPGISRTGMITAYAVARGAKQQNAANWAVMLTVPAMAVAAVLDVVSIASNGLGGVSFTQVVGYILGAAAAFGGTYFGTTFLRVILNRSGLSGFAYYSFGAALFSFVLYLIIW